MQEVSPCHDFIIRQISLLSDRLISGNNDTCYQFWPPLDSGGHQSSTLLALCEGNPLGTSGFPSQRASNAERISMPWLYHQTKIIIVWPTNFWEQWHLLPVLAPIRFRWTSKLHITGPAMLNVSPCHDFIIRQRLSLSDQLISGNVDTCYQVLSLHSAGHQSSMLLALCEGNHWAPVVPLTSGQHSHWVHHTNGHQCKKDFGVMTLSWETLLLSDQLVSGNTDSCYQVWVLLLFSWLPG